jgi:hypothetical protein
VVRTAADPAWPGYFGAPRLATAEVGRASRAAADGLLVGLALRILDGLDERTVDRYADFMLGLPVIKGIEATSAAKDAQLAERQAAWLRKRPR